jgi:hypothetical protein
MVAEVLEQVIVGKMSLPAVDGQISQFVPPTGFDWLRHLRAADIAEFLTELLVALNKGQQTGDWSAASETIEAWKETAEIRDDPILSASIAQGIQELSEGKGTTWAELRARIGLFGETKCLVS